MTQTKKLALVVGSFLGMTVLVSALTVPVFREAERDAQRTPAASQASVQPAARG